MPRLGTLLIAIALVAYSQPDSHAWATATRTTMWQIDQGQYAAALPAAEEAVRAAGNPQQVAISLGNILNVYVMLGRFDEAEHLGRKALRVAETLDADTKLKATIWHNMGHLYRATWRLRQAEGNFRKALELLESSPDTNLRQVAAARLGLGAVLLAQKLFAEAEQSLTRSMQEARQAKADDLVPAVMVLLGELFAGRNRSAEAEVSFLEAVAARERISGPEHPLLAEPLFGLAQIRFAQRRYAEADSLCRRVLAVVEKNLSPDHPELLYTARLRAKILRAQNRKSEAKQWAERAKALEEIQPNWQKHTVGVTALTGGQ